MTPTLTSLNLERSDCANGGGDHSGVVQLGKCLSEASASAGLKVLAMERNKLGAEAGVELGTALALNRSLQQVRSPSACLPATPAGPSKAALVHEMEAGR